MNFNLNLEYTQAQFEIFKLSEARRRMITKGRRLGFTRGGSQSLIEDMIEVPGEYLWGDTVNGNIERYVQRYWKPVLNQLGPQGGYWDWKKTEKIMFIMDSVCDFRSADNPENWEGFGYKKIILNEAGIILKNVYLWENSVSPMLLDDPESVAIIGGTPKGKTPPVFHDLYGYGVSDHPNYSDWQAFQYSTYDNPYLSITAIKDLESIMSEYGKRQEIYGEFVETTEDQFIDGLVIEEARKLDYSADQYIDDPLVLGIDTAGFGDNKNVYYFRQGLKTVRIRKKQNMQPMDNVAYIAGLIDEFEPDAVFIDVGKDGSSIIHRLRQLGYTVIDVDFGSKSSDKYYKNKRAEIWGRMRDWLLSGGEIPTDDHDLQRQLQQQEYFYTGNDGSVVQLVGKKKMASEGKMSPDEADALALTCAMPVRKLSPMEKLIKSRNKKQQGTAVMDYDIYAH